jgi:hypothetical protein
MTMRRSIIALLSASLIAAFSAQAAAASGHHRVRTMSRDQAIASEQFRNSNAYAAPDHIAVPSYLTNEATGAQAGTFGH